MVRAEVQQAGEHTVRFYTAEQELVAGVSAYLAERMGAGRPALVVAERHHIRAFEDRLNTMGVDIADGRWAALDAHQTLEGFMVDDRPDAAAFDATVGSRIRALNGPAAAYGEMVAILWQEGNVAGAIELEGLWNALLEQHRFSLYCAYPATILDYRDVSSIRRVCGAHAEILGDTVSTTLAPFEREERRTFPRAIDSPKDARRFVQQTLARWSLERYGADVTIVVSELATNAVLHAHTAFTVALFADADGLRIEVRDGDPRFPSFERTPRASLDTSGRGLLIVDALADRWGCDSVDDGKAVWARLRSV